MSEASRVFLDRLWQLQAEAGLSDPALAKELGVNHTTIYRLKQSGAARFNSRFFNAACARFPELGFSVPCDLRISTGTMRPVTDDGESEGAA